MKKKAEHKRERKDKRTDKWVCIKTTKTLHWVSMIRAMPDNTAIYSINLWSAPAKHKPPALTGLHKPVEV